MQADHSNIENSIFQPYDQYFVPNDIKYRQQSSHEVWSYIRKLVIPRNVGVGSWASHVCIICSFEKKMALLGEDLYHKCLLSCGNTSNANAHMERRHKDHEYTKRYIANRGLFFKRKGLKKNPEFKQNIKSERQPLRKKCKIHAKDESIYENSDIMHSPIELWLNKDSYDSQNNCLDTEKKENENKEEISKKIMIFTTDTMKETILNDKYFMIDRIYVSECDANTIHAADNHSVVLKDKEGYLKFSENYSETVGIRIYLDLVESEAFVIQMMEKYKYVLLCCNDWRLFSLDRIVETATETGCGIICKITSADQIEMLMSVFKNSLRGFLVPDDEKVMFRAFNLKTSCFTIPSARSKVRNSRICDIDLTEAVVTNVIQVGLGDRVSVDFVQLMDEGEGVLVGSSRKLLAFVQGETADMGLTSSRPFRINAGPVHSYILMADFSLKFLSEISPGDQLLVVKFHQDEKSTSEYELISRAVSVGRSTIEAKPLLMCAVETTHSEKVQESQIFIERNESVRLLSRDKSIPVTSIRSGDVLLVYLMFPKFEGGNAATNDSTA